MKPRVADIERKTKETNIQLNINLDGKGSSKVNTSIGFVDHMLELFAKHSLTDLTVTAKGDTNIDEHHLVEDMGIVLGEAIKKALLDKKGIKRYGAMNLPMDETLVEVTIDLSGRPCFVCNFQEILKTIYPTTQDLSKYEIYEHFFYSIAINSGMTLHINLKYGKNFHHIIEATFKAFARALKQAISFDAREKGIPSTKDML